MEQDNSTCSLVTRDQNLQCVNIFASYKIPKYYEVYYVSVFALYIIPECNELLNEVSEICRHFSRK
jgi:hypothetical protein